MNDLLFHQISTAPSLIPRPQFCDFFALFQNHRLWWRLYAYNLLVMDGILSRFKVKIIKKHACSWPRRGGHLLDFYIGPHDYHKTRQGCTLREKSMLCYLEGSRHFTQVELNRKKYATLWVIRVASASVGKRFNEMEYQVEFHQAYQLETWWFFRFTSCISNQIHDLIFHHQQKNELRNFTFEIKVRLFCHLVLVILIWLWCFMQKRY